MVYRIIIHNGYTKFQIMLFGLGIKSGLSKYLKCYMSGISSPNVTLADYNYESQG